MKKLLLFVIACTLGLFGTVSAQETSFNYDFDDNGSLAGWRLIDNDGDGFNWGTSNSTTFGGVGGTYGLYSSCFESDPLFPKNYIMTENKYLITESSVFSFVHIQSDAIFYQENICVVVSDDINDTPADFDQIWCEEYNSSYPEWQEVSVPLADYAGQTVYIGLYHYGSGSNANGIKVDNVKLVDGEGGGETQEPLSASITADNDKICENETIQFKVNATGGSGGYTYLWSPATGLDDATTANPTFTPTATDWNLPEYASSGRTYEYTCTVTDSENATVTVTKSVIVNDFPEITPITVQANYVEGGQTVIVDFSSYNLSPYTIFETVPSGKIDYNTYNYDDNNVLQSLGFIVGNTDEQFELIVTSHYGNGCKCRTTVTVKVVGRPLSLTASAEKGTIYSGETVQLTATANGGSGTYTYSWSPATGLDNASSATPTFTPSATGTYTFICTVSDGTETASASVTITVEKRPVSCEIEFILNDSYGDGWNGGQLTVVASDETNQTLTLSSGYTITHTLDIKTGSDVKVTYAAGSFSYENSYIIRYKDGDDIRTDGSGITGSVYTTEFITSCGPIPLSLTASAEKGTIYNGETVQLIATASGGTKEYTYSWSPATGLDNATIANPTFTPSAVGTYTFTCTVNDGETTETSNAVSVTVKERPAAPATAPVVTAEVLGSDAIKVSWTAVEGAEWYDLYASGDYNIERVYNLTTTEYIYRGLQAETEYCFIVDAVNPGGISTSNEVCVTTDKIKQYRIKVSTASHEHYKEYLHVSSYDDPNGNISNLQVSAWDDSNTQRFILEEASDGIYYLRTADGYYVRCGNNSFGKAWNVYANSMTEKTPIRFYYVDETKTNFYLTDYDKETGTNQNASEEKYFKVENGKIYCNAPSSNTDVVTWTLEEANEPTPIYIGDGNWTDADKWKTYALNSDKYEIQYGVMPAEKSDVIIDGNVTIPQDYVANVGDIDIISGSITIEDGGQLIHTNEGVVATVKKVIIGYEDASADTLWHTISSPIANSIATDEVTNLTTDVTYDLYYYDEPTHYWINHEDTQNNNGFNALESGRGYLYANKADVTLQFTGVLNHDNVSFKLDNKCSYEGLQGINLIGNPYTHNIYKGEGSAIDNENLAEGYYSLSKEGKWGAIKKSDEPIAPCQSILVKIVSEEKEETLEIKKIHTPTTTRATYPSITIGVANERYSDEAHVLFKDGIGLNKVAHMNEDIPMISVINDDDLYAIATMSEETEEIALRFEAMTMGQYTIYAKPQDGKFKQMVLTDMMNGTKTDLLNGSYTFMATTHDNPNRFVMTLSAEADSNADFIYINNGEMIISNIEGQGVLHIYDIMGRPVSEYDVNGFARISTGTFANGVYIVRLTDGNGVKTQKLMINN